MLPEGSAIVEMMDDCAVMRDQASACDSLRNLCENCQAPYQLDNGMEWLARVFNGVGHHGFDEN